MRNPDKRRRLAQRAVFVFIFITLYVSSGLGRTAPVWHIVLDDSLARDKAIRLAASDLQHAGASFGVDIKIVEKSKRLYKNSILVGSQRRNKLTAQLVAKGVLPPARVGDPQGYAISTLAVHGDRLLVVRGDAVRGEVNGLYRIWDRLKVNGGIPDINVTRTPALGIRFIHASSKKEIENALRYGATWVWGGPSVNSLVPWKSEPEASENAVNREIVRELANYAHSLHLKFIVYEDEFSFHPSLLKEFGARLSPDDPIFWDAVQAKYRRLLQALPEIDGIRLRTGEATRVGGSFKAFDVMHDGEGCDWSLAKRCRVFVRKIYDVVVGEFDKIYYQRTWATSAHEQHSVAEVYKAIFTDDVPVRNLYLSPYLSRTDRYFHQPYNPTFNRTPHNMIVLLAPLDYHANAGAHVLPTFPGPYFQNGLRTILRGETNVRGADFGVPHELRWDTRSLTAYTASRLSWNPDEDVRDIARDFAAMLFGQGAAEPLADMLLLSPRVYKYGVYIEPVAYSGFNSLPHLRLTTFPAKGLPRLDHGKKHIDFLYNIYLRCKPWQEETLLYLDYGLALADSLLQTAQTLGDDLGVVKNSAQLTYGLVQTNNLYVKTMFAYFDYRRSPTSQRKNLLQQRAAELKEAMRRFAETPNFVYRLDGPRQLLVNVRKALADLPAAEKRLADAPDDEGIRRIIADRQARYQKAMKEYAREAVKILCWQGRVDGRDLLKVRGDVVEIEHLRYDSIIEASYELDRPLPKKRCTVIPVDIQSRSFHPFVLEQPSEKNNYTATIYLSDFPEHGYSWWKFELWMIPRPPEEIGLAAPWDE